MDLLKVKKHILVAVILAGKVLLLINFLLILVISVRVYSLKKNNLKEEKFYHSLDDYRYIDLFALPSCAVKGIIALEDPNYFYHLGIDTKRLLSAKAYLSLPVNGTTSGKGSITQQTAMILWNHKENFISRYMVMITTIEMGIFLSKNRILELYLNNVKWGKDVFGIYAASVCNFNLPPQQLNCEQTDKLMEILANPFTK